MQKEVSTALSEALPKHIGLSATRRKTLGWLAVVILQCQVASWGLVARVIENGI